MGGINRYPERIQVPFVLRERPVRNLSEGETRQGRTQRRLSVARTSRMANRVIAVKGTHLWLTLEGESSNEPTPWPFEEAVRYAEANPRASVYIVRGWFRKKIYPDE